MYIYIECRDLVVQPSSCRGIQQLLRVPEKSGAELPSLLGAKLGLAVIIRLKHGWDDTLPYARSAGQCVTFKQQSTNNNDSGSTICIEPL
jgi:hypothetical protein